MSELPSADNLPTTWDDFEEGRCPRCHQGKIETRETRRHGKIVGIHYFCIEDGCGWQWYQMLNISKLTCLKST